MKSVAYVVVMKSDHVYIVYGALWFDVTRQIYDSTVVCRVYCIPSPESEFTGWSHHDFIPQLQYDGRQREERGAWTPLPRLNK